MKLTRTKKGRRPILPRSAKNKGAAFQKKITKLLASILKVDPDKIGHGDDCLLKPKRMGESGVDIHIDQSLRDKFPIAIECKNNKSASVPATIKQVLPYVKNGYKHWMCFMKIKTHHKPIVIMELDVFEKIMVNLNSINEETWQK